MKFMEKDQKSWFKRHPVWTGIIGLFVFVFLMGTLTEESEHKQLESSGQAIKELSEQETEEPITQENNTFSVPIEDETPNTEKQEETDNEEISEPTTPAEPLNQNGFFLVTRVIDGDTIEIEGGERVRFVCINTPEVGEYIYLEAKNFVTDILLYKEVKLVKDVTDRDRYGRLLRYIYLEDGTFVNEQIVRVGYGVAYPYGADTKYCPLIENAEREAREDEIGIWAIEEEEPEEEPDTEYVCSSNVYNCGDFSSCSEAMNVFNYCSGDIHKLDGDDDGIPCESLCG